MPIQLYRTEREARRYAREIMAKFPSVKAEPELTGGFNYCVRVTMADGRRAVADRRPRRYGAAYPADVLQGNFRIPNSAGL